ncbi:MAG: hypothetical protein QOG68_305 [Solirubrobacteraceae bacterium]|nr:hypothetical protein [Solirubrobacteraceae bacterium]
MGVELPRRVWPLVAMSSLGAALLVAFGPPGTDFAAHAYQEALFAAHGFSLWNNFWYSGRYSFVTYSTLYYPLAALIGIRALAVLCVGAAVAAFAAVARRRWGTAGRWSIRSFAVVMPAFVLTAAFPFLLGAALALLAILALQDRRWWIFAVLCALAAAASPLAFVLLGVVVAGIGLGERVGRRSLLLGLGILGAVAAMLLLSASLFPSSARYPFPTQAFVLAIAFSVALAVVTWRVEGARSLRFIAVLNGVACLTAFVVSSEIGEGITRLRFVALPIMLLAVALRRWRPRALVVVVLMFAAYWNFAPLMSSFFGGSADASLRLDYWRPAIAFLHDHLTPSYRVEVVDTQRHWAADYLPAGGIPIVRGWFRQDDFPQNELLYDELTASGYQRWLRSLGVRFVVLTDAAPDYSARREAALLRGGQSGLRTVFRSAHLRIYEVPSPRAIISGPGHPQITVMGRERLTATVTTAGSYRIAIRYSPHWRASEGCLSSGADGMLRLRMGRPGPVRMRFDVSLGSALRALKGDASPVCANP